MQTARVQSLVQEDSTCHRASKAQGPKLLSLHPTTTEAHVPRAWVPQQEKQLQREAHVPR